jgi:hypothetical protein
MKIKSRFKDYYDYVAHAYGGGDERVTYVREPFKDDHIVASSKSTLLQYDYDIKEYGSLVQYLVVNGKFYVMVSILHENGLRDKFRLLTEENFGHCVGRIFRRWNTKKIDWSKYFGVDSEAATEISQQIKQPVFIVNRIEWDRKTRTYRFTIDQNIPVLQECGINHHIQPEQLYQETAYYISNKMVTSPDLVVVNSMSDKEKILQHGFDTKQSFRHRM